MKVWIEIDQCTGSGLCELIEERVFTVGDDGFARVQQDGRVLPPGPGNPAEVPDTYADGVHEASRACPGGCIRYQLLTGGRGGHQTFRSYTIRPGASDGYLTAFTYRGRRLP